MAGGGEGGDVTEADSEAQMQQQAPDEAAPTSASAPGPEAPASTREVSTHPGLHVSPASAGIPMLAVRMDNVLIVGLYSEPWCAF